MNPLNLGLVMHVKSYSSDANNFTSNSKKSCEFRHFKDSMTIQ